MKGKFISQQSMYLCIPTFTWDHDPKGVDKCGMGHGFFFAGVRDWLPKTTRDEHYEFPIGSMVGVFGADHPHGSSQDPEDGLYMYL